MKLELQMKYLETVYQRYRKSSKHSKGKILDELCNVCQYNRKYAIWRLGALLKEDKPKSRTRRRRQNSRHYSLRDIHLYKQESPESLLR